MNEQWWTVDELKFVNRYYNVPPDELVFLTKAEHCKFHRKYGPSSKSIIDSQNGFSSRCELAKKQKLYHDKLVEGCKKRSSNPEYRENLAKSMENVETTEFKNCVKHSRIRHIPKKKDCVGVKLVSWCGKEGRWKDSTTPGMVNLVNPFVTV